jgi:hypothetical protein
LPQTYADFLALLTEDVESTKNSIHYIVFSFIVDTVTVRLSSLVPCWIGVLWGVTIADFYATINYKWYESNDAMVTDISFPASSIYSHSLKVYPF